jgi:hypothetical protein
MVGALQIRYSLRVVNTIREVQSVKLLFTGSVKQHTINSSLAVTCLIDKPDVHSQKIGMISYYQFLTN